MSVSGSLNFGKGAGGSVGRNYSAQVIQKMNFKKHTQGIQATPHNQNGISTGPGKPKKNLGAFQKCPHRSRLEPKVVLELDTGWGQWFYSMGIRLFYKD